MRAVAPFLFPLVLLLSACGGKESAAAAPADGPWNADAYTVASVGRMQAHFDQAAIDPAKAQPQAFRQLADQLQNEVDALLAGCKMTGPDHDRLHRWLGELLGSVQILRESKDVAELGRAHKALGATLAQFKVLFRPPAAK